MNTLSSFPLLRWLGVFFCDSGPAVEEPPLLCRHGTNQVHEYVGDEKILYDILREDFDANEVTVRLAGQPDAPEIVKKFPN